MKRRTRGESEAVLIPTPTMAAVQASFAAMGGVLTDAEYEVIESALDSFAGRTRRALMIHLNGLQAWWLWSQLAGRPSWPARPGDVAAYAAALLDGGMSLAALRRRVAMVIGGAHRRAGLPDPTEAVTVRALLWPQGLGRGFGHPWYLATEERVAIEAALALFTGIAERTRTKYRSRLCVWWRWCARNDRRPWPAAPDDVAAYAAELLAGGARLRTVRLRVSTVLGGTHRRAGLPDPSVAEAVEVLLWPNGGRLGPRSGQRADALPAPDEAAIDEVLSPFAGLSQITLAAYRSRLRVWWRWCARNDRRPWPAAPDDVAAYAAELLAGGARLRTVRLRVSTVLGGTHRRAGLPDPSVAEAVEVLLWPNGGRLGPRSGQRADALPAPDEAAIDEVLSPFAGLSQITLAAYRSRLRVWWRWCARNDRRPWPAAPDDVAAYAAELLAGGARLGYARQRIATVLGGAHRRAGLPDPSAGDAVQALLWPERSRQRNGKLPARDEAVLDSLLASLADRSASTLRNYRYHLRAWWRWCARSGRRPWPARPGDVAAYTAELLSEGASVRGVQIRISVMLGGAHRRAGLPDPSDEEPVQALLWPDRAGQRRIRVSPQDDAAITAVVALFGSSNWYTYQHYRYSLRAWWRWCARSGRRPWPARPGDVVAYTAELLDGGASVRGVHQRVVTVLGRAHRLSGLPDPSTGAAVRALLRPDLAGTGAEFPVRWRGGLCAQDEAAVAAVLASFGDLSPGTLLNYRAQLRAWWRWCVGNERRPWPARPEDVVAYTTEILAVGTSVASARQRIATVLGGAHRRAGLPDPSGEDAVKALLGSGRAGQPRGRRDSAASAGPRTSAKV